MTRQDKEDKLMDDLKDVDSKKKDNVYISKMIDDTIASKHKVYLATDWHLYKRVKKGQSKCNKRSGFAKVMDNVRSTMKNGDMLIFLGDLTDGEFKEKLTLRQVMLNELGMIKNKVMLRGNNDLFEPSFYEECGFLKCVDSFVWKNILFSHVPQKNDYELNIHGHIHGSLEYWVPYRNQIDVGAYNGRDKLVELKWLIKQYPKYKKKIRENPEHFEEGYMLLNEPDLFNSIMEESIPFIQDPFYD